jgi:hypothetical protein
MQEVALMMGGGHVLDLRETGSDGTVANGGRLRRASPP